MWEKIGKFILAGRLPLLIVVLGSSIFMGYWAMQAKMSYEFVRAIPENHPANIELKSFKKKYGQDGNMLALGIRTDKYFDEDFFNEFNQFESQIQKVPGVTKVISAGSSINLIKNPETEKLQAVPIFPKTKLSKAQINSCRDLFLSLPFYKNLIYNKATDAWLVGVSIDNALMNTIKRNDVVNAIYKLSKEFEKKHHVPIHISGLPYIRTELTTRISAEMKWFLFASVVLSALILLVFFRSVSTMLLSLLVVGIGVVYALGTMALLGFELSMLSALIPPLIVVIGIPNCIYFLNKYHTSYNETGDKKQALINMVGKMGVVMFFCNLAAAIGFAVFSLTESQVLREFGIVSGINIFLLFFISLTIIPIVLSYLPSPKSRHTKYLHSPRLNRWLVRLERWALNHRRLIYLVTALALVFSITGIMRLQRYGYIVDDLPQNDKMYADLKFFEKNFKGLMPLEILISTKNKQGIIRDFEGLQNIDSLAGYLQSLPELAKPLAITEGLKFAKQAFFEGDSASYSMPGEWDMPVLLPYLKTKNAAEGDKKGMAGILSNFLDSSRQETRVSASMQDVGSKKLPLILNKIKAKTAVWFPADKYNVVFTGTSIGFLEGSRYIINGLTESIIWAFVLIAACMLYLFKSLRILASALVPNIIPLAITAGIMGWAGIPLKPSTVLVFSVALGIAIDITIRFLINYKQERVAKDIDKKTAVIATIHNAGISIIYTSLVLIAGFIIFSFSNFGGTKSLGILTSITLVTATAANLLLLPALLIGTDKKENQTKTTQ